MGKQEKRDDKQNRIETKELKIMDNVFIYNETIIPLSNMSRISLTDAPTQEFKLSYFAAVLLGLCSFFTGNGLAILVGCMLMVWGIWEIYKVDRYNNDRGEYLVLCLNSGEKIFLLYKDHKFATQVMQVIINCINSGHSYVINMEKCTIQDSSFNEITNNLFVEE